jgi:hypothetical protein
MSLTATPFDRRLKRIVRRHSRLNVGAVHKIDSTGLIVAHPRIYNPRFPLKGLVLLVMAGFAFKGYLHADLSASVYDARVAQLSSGTAVEQAGAWVMQSDPATLFISDVLKKLGV